MMVTLGRRVTAEIIGTAFLLAAVVRSGAIGERLAGGNVAVALLANTLATGTALVALILTLGPISRPHFNPAVTLSDASLGGLQWNAVPSYIGRQLVGALFGVALADTMFGEPIFSASLTPRRGAGLLLGEFLATFGLLGVIWSCSWRRSNAVPLQWGPT